MMVRPEVHAEISATRNAMAQLRSAVERNMQVAPLRHGGETASHLVALAEAYADHVGLTLSTVSTYAANDGKWLGKLKSAEVSCTLRKAEAVTFWLSQHWPIDLEWPRHIPRPSAKRGNS